MKIKEMTLWSQNLKLKTPYEIAYETIAIAPQVFLEIKTSNPKITGFGCAAPDLEVTCETIETVTRTFNEKVEPVLKNSNPLRIDFQMEKFRNEMIKNPSCMAMLNMALFDILGKYSNLPVYMLLGGFRNKIKTSITIGILPIGETVKEAEKYVRQGFKSLKIKGGNCVLEDIEKVNKVREAIGKKIEIRFDANQGYSVEDTMKFFKHCKQTKIEILEQPTKKNDLMQMKELTNRIDIPVMADESLMTLMDAFKLARRDIVDMINIKLMKVGGITEAVHINSVSKAAGLEVMVGCMDESALAISAGLHFALSKKNVYYADLDGHFDLEDDPAKGAVILKDGMLYPTEKPGLGFNLL